MPVGGIQGVSYPAYLYGRGGAPTPAPHPPKGRRPVTKRATPVLKTQKEAPAPLTSTGVFQPRGLRRR
jgi:hypothetical protein